MKNTLVELFRSESNTIADALERVMENYSSRKNAAIALQVPEALLQKGTSRSSSLRMTKAALATIGRLTGLDTSRMGG
jgi:hypothetical protein